MSKDYDKKYFENVSGYSQHGGYSQMQKGTIKWYKGIFSFLEKKTGICLEQGNGGKILDVGCAYGYVISELNGRGFETYGMDISKHAIQIAKEQNGTSQIKVGDLQNRIPFKEEFDLILCLEVI